MNSGALSLEFGVRPIGYVVTGRERLEDTPIQTCKNPDEHGQIVMYDEFAAGLAGLEGFDFIHMICLLDRARDADIRRGQSFTPDRLRQVPLMREGKDERRVGVFATRFPVRPNYLALSVVRVLAISEATIDFAGVDVMNGTPVLDIKPWEAHLDVPGYGGEGFNLEAIRGGWYREADALASAAALPERSSFERIGLLPPS